MNLEKMQTFEVEKYSHDLMKHTKSLFTWKKTLDIVVSEHRHFHSFSQTKTTNRRWSLYNCTTFQAKQSYSEESLYERLYNRSEIKFNHEHYRIKIILIESLIIVPYRNSSIYYRVWAAASFRAASCRSCVSTSSPGSWTYLTTDPRMKQFFTESFKEETLKSKMLL